MTETHAGAGPVTPGPRRAFRDTRAPIAGGVASGLASHLGVPVLWVRVAFIVTAGFGGFGVMLYAGLWVFLPRDSSFTTGAPGLESASRDGRRPGRVGRLTDSGPAIVMAVLALAAILALEALVGAGGFFWPVVVGTAGVVLLWRQADEAQRERWLDSSGRIDAFRAVFGRGGWAAYARTAAGALLIVLAIGMFAVGSGRFEVAGDLLVAAALGVVGLALVLVPWAVRLLDDLGTERAERVRTQERADLAAHLHDSVLQTLALIQKNADDGAAVGRLARSQERELRSWLFDSTPPGGDSLAAALRAVAAQVEDDHGVAIDVVTVGDAVLEDDLRAVVNAGREAMTNAALHAGTGRLDVYAEVTSSVVDVFVRDRGAGFDPGAVPPDRHGVRESIVARMERHGGRAEVRSRPGEGTEVRLRVPRHPGGRPTTGGDR